MIYAIVPLEKEIDVESLEKVIKEIDEKAYMGHAPHIFFVSYDGTSSELVKHLGFTSKNKPPLSGIVLTVSLYNGFANEDMWAWLLNKKGMVSQ